MTVNLLNNSIFKSVITLKYTKETYEADYEKYCKPRLLPINKLITKINQTIAIITLITCIILFFSEFSGILTYKGYSDPINHKDIKKYKFITSSIKLAIVDIIIFFIIKEMIPTKQIENADKLNKLIYFLNYLLLGFSFHIFAGIIRSFFLSTSELLIFIQGMSILLRSSIIFYNKGNWLLNLFSSLFLIMFQILLLVKIHDHVNQSLKNYIITDSVFLMFMVALAYLSEYIDRVTFFSENKNKLQKEHLNDIINNIQQGFIVFKSSEGLKFANKSAERIFAKAIVENKGLYSLFNNNINLNASQEDLLNHFNLEKSYEKSFIKLFSHITNINPDLPKELYSYFNRFVKTKYNSSKDINSFFSLEELAKVIEINNINIQLANFVKIGNLICKSENISSNIIEQPSKEYEIHFRNIKIDEENYFEFILSDISDIIMNERKLTMNSCKYNYLSKIAHEINNPICSILELSDEIIKESNKRDILDNKNVIENLYSDNNQLSVSPNEAIFDKSKNNSPINNCSQINFENISYSAKYINNICNFMNYLIQDFLLTSSFNEFCIVCEKATNLCIECNQYSKCIICNTCGYCSKAKNNSLFNYNKSILNCVNVFQTKNELEDNNTFKIESNLNPQESSQKINNNEDYFNSIIFNLLYHIYYKNKHNTVYITSKYSNLSLSMLKEYYSFEIIEATNLDLFKISTSSKLYSYDEYSKYKNISDNYEKYVHLYNAYILSKKLGSDSLFIEVNEGGTKYSFNAKNYEYLDTISTNLIKKVSSKFSLKNRRKRATSKLRKKQTSKSLVNFSENVKIVNDPDNTPLPKIKKSGSFKHLDWLNIKKNKGKEENDDDSDVFDNNSQKSFDFLTDPFKESTMKINIKKNKKEKTSADKDKENHEIIQEKEAMLEKEAKKDNSSSSEEKSLKVEDVIENDDISVKTEIFENYKITHVGSLENLFSATRKQNQDSNTGSINEKELVDLDKLTDVLIHSSVNLESKENQEIQGSLSKTEQKDSPMELLNKNYKADVQKFSTCKSLTFEKNQKGSTFQSKNSLQKMIPEKNIKNISTSGNLTNNIFYPTFQSMQKFIYKDKGGVSHQITNNGDQEASINYR